MGARRSGKTHAVVDYFNERCPAGTEVIYWPAVREGSGVKSRTRSKAWLLGGHAPVVMVEGYSGGIALTHDMVTAAYREVWWYRTSAAPTKRGLTLQEEFLL